MTLEEHWAALLRDYPDFNEMTPGLIVAFHYGFNGGVDSTMKWVGEECRKQTALLIESHKNAEIFKAKP